MNISSVVKGLIKIVLVGVAIALLQGSILLTDSPKALAAGYPSDQSHQPQDRSALLAAPNHDTEVPVYPQPNTRQPSQGYGLDGDAVTVLEQMSNNQGDTWYSVRFNNPPHVEGWVQSSFIRLRSQTDDPAKNDNQSTALQNDKQSAPYLGDPSNRQQQSTYRQKSNR